MKKCSCLCIVNKNVAISICKSLYLELDSNVEKLKIKKIYGDNFQFWEW
jgi:hypothetical protein